MQKIGSFGGVKPLFLRCFRVVPDKDYEIALLAIILLKTGGPRTIT